VGRFASALAFLCTLVVILGSAGCGQRFDELGADQAPAPADLAGDALSALAAAGSAHVVFDSNTSGLVGTDAQFGVHFEGDISKSAVAGDAELRLPGATVGARILAGEHDFYVRFMGTWYHAGTGIGDALAAAKKRDDDLVNDLMTVAGLRQRFDELFEGKVTEGPVIAGMDTWQFDGSFRADTFAKLTEKYDHVQLTDNDRALLVKVAAASRLTLVVGRDDHLPRRLDFKLVPPRGLAFDAGQLRTAAGSGLSIHVELSDFGTDVSFTAPNDVKPLDELVSQFFGSFE
jgi:hypothetical protein